MKNDELKKFAQMLSEELKKPKEVQPTEIQVESTKPVEVSSIDMVSQYLSKKRVASETAIITETNNSIEEAVTNPANIEKQRWADPLVPLDQKFVTVKDMNDHYTKFLARIQQQMSSIGGGGEVKFLKLDDVVSSSKADNRVLEFDAFTGKVQFTDEIGPIQSIVFDPLHINDHTAVGTLCWSFDDNTLNLHHNDGVVQQIGQEQFAYVRNRSGNLIPNGTAVRFSGAEEDSTARLLIEPFLGNGAYPNLYGLGITTQDIDDGADGFVTVWGKVRDIDTSAWNVGDILYVSANTAGELTNLKPTAPNNVIPFAAVLRKSALSGEIFVRPTIEQQKYYGRFGRTTTQSANTINVGYPVQFNDTEISNGVSIGSPSSRILVSNSGFYQFDVSTQITATSNKGIVYLWCRKNEEDIPLSSRSTTVTNGDVFTLHLTLQISLDANDYIEVIWATTAAGITLQAEPSPTVGPTVASVLISVAQLHL